MKRIATTIRCVPRFGYDYAQPRTLDLDLPELTDERRVHAALNQYFMRHGVAHAVYAVESDENGYLAIVNDEAYRTDWGEPLL